MTLHRLVNVAIDVTVVAMCAAAVSGAGVAVVHGVAEGRKKCPVLMPPKT